MLKRTLFFVNPYHLSIRNQQLVARNKENKIEKTVPVEDIGYAVFDNQQISFTQSVTEHFAKNNVALSGSGLLPTLGIHHHNRYNACRLADDIMEPYRAIVDELVLDDYARYPDYEDLTTEIKMGLPELLTLDVKFEKVKFLDLIISVKSGIVN